MRIKIENFCLFKESRTLRATCDITLGKTVTIHQVKIINGQSGLFVNMPTRKVGTQYEEICTILDENVKKEIRTALLEKYSQCNKSQQGEDDLKRLSSFVTIVLLLLAIIAGSLCKQWLTAENQKVQSNAGVSNTEGNSPASASSLAPHMYLTIPRTDIQGGVGISEEEGELWLESGCGPESTNIVIYGSTGEDGIFTQLWRWDNAEFAMEHPIIRLQYQQEIMEYEIFSAGFALEEPSVPNPTPDEFVQLVNSAIDRSTINHGAYAAEGDFLRTLIAPEEEGCYVITAVKR